MCAEPFVMSQKALRRSNVYFGGYICYSFEIFDFFFYFFSVKLILLSCSRGVKDENYTFEKMGIISDLDLNSHELQKI